MQRSGQGSSGGRVQDDVQLLAEAELADSTGRIWSLGQEWCGVIESRSGTQRSPGRPFMWRLNKMWIEFLGKTNDIRTEKRIERNETIGNVRKLFFWNRRKLKKERLSLQHVLQCFTEERVLNKSNVNEFYTISAMFCPARRCRFRWKKHIEVLSQS